MAQPFDPDRVEVSGGRGDGHLPGRSLGRRRPPARLGRPAWLVQLAVVIVGSAFTLGVVPRFIEVISTAKQKRTVADIRNIGSATITRLFDEIEAAKASSPGTDDEGATGAPAGLAGPADVVDVNGYPVVSVDELEALLVDELMEYVPTHDAWGHPLELRLGLSDGSRPGIAIRSPGWDGRFDTDVYVRGAFDPTDFDQDLVWADGYFVRWPRRDGDGPE